MATIGRFIRNTSGTCWIAALVKGTLRHNTTRTVLGFTEQVTKHPQRTINIVLPTCVVVVQLWLQHEVDITDTERFHILWLIHLTRKEGNVLFNDALNTFYLRLYGVRHMVKDHSDSEKGNQLPPHRLLFPINSKGSFICTIP